LIDLLRALEEDRALLDALSSTEPPFYIRRWVRMLGLSRALLLLERLGGLRISVPGRVRPSGALARDCGIEVAALLVRLKRNSLVRVPLGRSWRAAVWLAAGYSIGSVAAHLRCTESAVQRAAAQYGLTSRTGIAPRRRNTTA
jgi:hypothetical protein